MLRNCPHAMQLHLPDVALQAPLSVARFYAESKERRTTSVLMFAIGRVSYFRKRTSNCTATPAKN